MDASFNWLKSVVLENRRMFDNSIRMMKMDRKMYQWKYNIWQNGEKKCPEPHLLTDQDKIDRIEMLKQKKESFILKPFDEDQHPHLAAYKKQIQIDREAGNLESIDTMLKTGIFWTTVKCPKCAREAPPMRHFFFNPCKLCRQIQATALLGHMPCDEKFFGWIFKEGSTISEDDLQKITQPSFLHLVCIHLII